MKSFAVMVTLAALLSAAAALPQPQVDTATPSPTSADGLVRRPAEFDYEKRAAPPPIFAHAAWEEKRDTSESASSTASSAATSTPTTPRIFAKEAWEESRK